jgi:hypothetical protein
MPTIVLCESNSRVGYRPIERTAVFHNIKHANVSKLQGRIDSIGWNEFRLPKIVGVRQEPFQWIAIGNVQIGSGAESHRGVHGRLDKIQAPVVLLVRICGSMSVIPREDSEGCRKEKSLDETHVDLQERSIGKSTSACCARSRRCGRKSDKMRCRRAGMASIWAYLIVILDIS